MNRHHPYGGPYTSPPRRGGPPGGFGPDRSHRFSDRGGPPRGRGHGRGGRGAGGNAGAGAGAPQGGSTYGGYEGNFGGFDQGPPQGDMGGYNNYESAPGQDPFYQNGSFDSTPAPGEYGSSADSSGRFNQGYGNFEDDSGSNYGQSGYGGRPPKRFPRREKDDKYETDSDDVRRLFEEHGEIRTFFDLIANRGMVFVTYFDLRAAERARERLQGSEISGRPIDVHYSLPRDDHGARGGEKDKNQVGLFSHLVLLEQIFIMHTHTQQLQGTLLVTLRNSATGQAIDDNEVRRKFQQFGDVKSVSPAGDRTDQRFVEFYDTRACDESHDRLRHQGLQDGVMEIVFAADGEDPRGLSPR
ncbi:uncharacterized protein FIBRA_08515 [Fibroporia radiculosa]|uniref:RRM domain-containing protein n=1 Tax=Fibroporia radiculosa TaxID=599839 RepID=J4GWY3_9APHY|nr:uncharacterized protein FIBRA_08515 [Fibroporia radiculosa]CCM06265.1 predicted protein [Fibroporia radiculosa]